MPSRRDFTIEVDQSWKIEKFDKATIVAFSDGIKGSIRISQRVKRAAFASLEGRYGRSKENIFRVFAAAVLLLLQKYHTSHRQVIIDEEYGGRMTLVVKFMTGFASRCGIRLNGDQIISGNIGKHSKAHWEAYAVFTKKKQAGFNISMSEFVGFLEKCDAKGTKK